MYLNSASLLGYKDRSDKTEEFMEEVIEPGNDGLTFGDCYVEPAAANLKEELLNLPEVAQVHYAVELAKAKVHLASDQGRKLRCEEANWEDKYGLKRGAAITIEYLLALQIYCGFSGACSALSATFSPQKGETFASLKKRHSRYAQMAKNLREFIEGFGTKLRKGAGGVPGMFYRGISKTFSWEKTILRFNGPMSTTVNRSIAEEFASMGQVLALQPHWKGFRGNIRALDCRTFSDFSHESEWLFIGGLEPLVVHNILDRVSCQHNDGQIDVRVSKTGNPLKCLSLESLNAKIASTLLSRCRVELSTMGWEIPQRDDNHDYGCSYTISRRYEPIEIADSSFDDDTRHWAIFQPKVVGTGGYFRQLKDEIDARHLQIISKLVLHPTMKELQAQYCESLIHIGTHTYILDFYSQSNCGESQLFSIADSAVPSNTQHVVRFQGASSSWMWYDDARRQFLQYPSDPLLYFELEASYWANKAVRFPNGVSRSRMLVLCVYAKVR